MSNGVDRNAAFDEWLDGAFPVYEIGSLSYQASDILAEVDPTAYRVTLNDWLSENCEQCGSDISLESDQCPDFEGVCRFCCGCRHLAEVAE